MYFLVEHNGTPDHIKWSNEIRDFIESEFGASTQDVVSYGNSITIYNDELKPITSYSKCPDKASLNFAISNFIK